MTKIIERLVIAPYSYITNQQPNAIRVTREGADIYPIFHLSDKSNASDLGAVQYIYDVAWVTPKNKCQSSLVNYIESCLVREYSSLEKPRQETLVRVAIEASQHVDRPSYVEVSYQDEHGRESRVEQRYFYDRKEFIEYVQIVTSQLSA